MYCPNCGAQNKKKQNYCRYCGLHLLGIEKLFLNQLIFGEDSKQFEILSNIRKFLGYAQVFLFVLLAVGIFKIATTDFDDGKDLIKFGVVSFMVLLSIGQTIGYFQRQNRMKNKRQIVSNEAGQSEFKTIETSKLIEEKPFSPVSAIKEESTELLFVDKKTTERVEVQEPSGLKLENRVG
jgi:hypothetical protein